VGRDYPAAKQSPAPLVVALSTAMGIPLELRELPPKIQLIGTKRANSKAIMFS
jgi:hypothetical protein